MFPHRNAAHIVSDVTTLPSSGASVGDGEFPMGATGFLIPSGTFTGELEISFDQILFFPLIRGIPYWVCEGQSVYIQNPSGASSGSLQLAIWPVGQEGMVGGQSIAMALGASGLQNQVEGVQGDGEAFNQNPVGVAGLSQAGNVEPFVVSGSGVQFVQLSNGASSVLVNPATQGSDAQATSTAVLPVTSVLRAFNGSSFDRLRANDAAPTTAFRLAVAAGAGEMVSINVSNLQSLALPVTGTSFSLGCAMSNFTLFVEHDGTGGNEPTVHLQGKTETLTEWQDIGSNGGKVSPSNDQVADTPVTQVRAIVKAGNAGDGDNLLVTIAAAK